MNIGQILTLAQVESEKLYNDLMQVAPFLGWIFLGMGILFIAIALPLAYKKIGPNNWYGFRTKKSMSSLDVWYDVNSLTGKGMAIVGIALSVVNCIALFLIYGGKWSPELSIAMLIVNIVLIDGGLITTIILAFLRMDKLNNGKDDWA